MCECVNVCMCGTFQTLLVCLNTNTSLICIPIHPSQKKNRQKQKRKSLWRPGYEPARTLCETWACNGLQISRGFWCYRVSGVYRVIIMLK